MLGIESSFNKYLLSRYNRLDTGVAVLFKTPVLRETKQRPRHSYLHQERLAYILGTLLYFLKYLWHIFLHWVSNNYNIRSA